jgi:hypothetical protein
MINSSEEILKKLSDFDKMKKRTHPRGVYAGFVAETEK